MVSKVELVSGGVALACFAGAADAWFGTGAVDFLVDLCLSDPNGALPGLDGMAMPGGGHSTHASLFLAGGLAAMGLGLSFSEFPSLFERRPATTPAGQARRRLTAAIVYVARACEGTTPKDVALAFRTATGVDLERGEVARALKSLRTSRGATLERILNKAVDDDEKRQIMSVACDVWFQHGVDSERAARAMERVAAALGLEGNDINSALDARWSIDPTLFLKSVESLARKTVSRVSTQAQRVTTRIRGVG